MQGALISVIIPVYNVDEYLAECVDSVIGQTYKNLEIILVDDGSTDRSGSICDEYRLRDARIRVIHKTNGGISSARNAGLEIAQGSYIGFVDSDDYIADDMFSQLYMNIKDNCQISVCFNNVVDGTKIFAECQLPDKITILSNEEAVKELIVDSTIKNYVCNKLYRAELFSGLRFPEGKIYEDIAINYLLFDRAEHISVIPKTLYYYRMRSGSVSAHKTDEKKWFHNCCAMIENKRERYEYFREHKNSSLPEMALASMIPSLYEGIRLARKYSADDKEDEFRLFLQNHRKLIRRNTFVRRKEKMLLPFYSNRRMYTFYNKWRQ